MKPGPFYSYSWAWEQGSTYYTVRRGANLPAVPRTVFSSWPHILLHASPFLLFPACLCASPTSCGGERVEGRGEEEEREEGENIKDWTILVQDSILSPSGSPPHFFLLLDLHLLCLAKLALQLQHILSYVSFLCNCCMCIL